jgi:1-acyl-sn-glycerol-3-phosphate acyltransferase
MNDAPPDAENPKASDCRPPAPPRSVIWRVAQVIAWLFTTLLFDLKVFGKRNIPRRGGALLLANHQSYLDPVLVAVKIDRPVSYMAKAELFEKKGLFKRLIESLHAFPVKRGTGDVGAIKQAIGRLEQGYLLNMYPEGTRSKTGDLGPILPGVAVIVRRAGVPVIPVIIDGSFRAMPKGAKFLRKCQIRIYYGQPLKIDGLKGQEIVDLIARTLQQMLADARARRDHA